MGGENKKTEVIVWLSCGVAALLFFVAIASIAHLHGVQSERQQQRTEQHGESAQAAARRACGTVPAERVFECAYEEIQASKENERAEDNLSAQQSMARWTFATFMAGIIAIIISSGGLIALLRSVRQGQETYNAFVAVEDASLVVEFKPGRRVEMFKDGVKEPDTYFIPVVITNIGRSTARLHGWSIKRGAAAIGCRKDHTLKAGDTFDGFEQIMVDEPAKRFTLHVPYSSPVRDHMILEVFVRLWVRNLMNMTYTVHTRVEGTNLRRAKAHEE